MKAVYTPAALRDLAEIADWLAFHYPAIAPAVDRRIRAVAGKSAAGPRVRGVQPSAPVCALFRSAAIPTRYSIGLRPIALKSFTSITRHGGHGTSKRSPD